MAFLESAVVVYIRELLYPDGFGFPLATMEPSLALTEILREAATIIMLAGAAVVTGKTFSQRFAWFLYCFAVWDIFYYVFLKLLIDWPSSLFEWDVLFLIPLTWTGPVISPLIVTLLMIILAMVIISFSNRAYDTVIKLREWIMLISGAIILIISFVWDYSGFILDNYSFSELWNLPDRESFFELSVRYVPGKFNYYIYFTGIIVISLAIVVYYLRLKKKS
jgi:hypothetical protein